jgi:hypothetical protein
MRNNGVDLTNAPRFKDAQMDNDRKVLGHTDTTRSTLEKLFPKMISLTTTRAQIEYLENGHVPDRIGLALGSNRMPLNLISIHFDPLL